ncbi:MAG: SAM-dependent methyltransferase [Pseudonocardiaceae bacterium]
MQNTHEVAQQIVSEARIVYVDNDPLVLVHARALLANTTPEGVATYVDADLRSLQQLARCFEGMELVDPGVVPITQWRRDATEVGKVELIDAYGAVARKP